MGSPVPLRLLGTIPGDRGAEKDLHRRFAAQHVQGEWFRPCAEMLALCGTAHGPTTGQYAVEVASVSIRILTVNRRQLTRSIIGQLERRPLLATWELADDLVKAFEASDKADDLIKAFEASDKMEMEFDEASDSWLWKYVDGQPWGYVVHPDPKVSDELIVESYGQLLRCELGYTCGIKYPLACEFGVREFKELRLRREVRQPRISQLVADRLYKFCEPMRKNEGLPRCWEDFVYELKEKFGQLFVR